MANAGPLTADPAVELEDQALVARARAGERDALEALVERQCCSVSTAGNV